MGCLELRNIFLWKQCSFEFPGHFAKALFTPVELFNKASLTNGFWVQIITWESKKEVLSLSWVEALFEIVENSLHFSITFSIPITQVPRPPNCPEDSQPCPLTCPHSRDFLSLHRYFHPQSYFPLLPPSESLFLNSDVRKNTIWLNYMKM